MLLAGVLTAVVLGARARDGRGEGGGHCWAHARVTVAERAAAVRELRFVILTVTYVSAPATS